MASINSSQDYDIIYTLTYDSGDVGPSNTNQIILHCGSSSSYSGTVYYREGTSGSWTSLSVSGYSTTFPTTSTTMQIAHDWNKSGDDYMTPGFMWGTMKSVSISQKAALSGDVGSYFMYQMMFENMNIETLDAPDTSGVTSVGNSFMSKYTDSCHALTSLAVPDTSNAEYIGDSFMSGYASGEITSLAVPDTSNAEYIGDSFLSSYASGCHYLTSLAAPDISSIVDSDSPYDFLKAYASQCYSLTSLGVPDTSMFTLARDNFMSGYASGCSALTSLPVPDTSNVTEARENFMSNYASSCNSLISLGVPDTSNIIYIGEFFMLEYAYDSNSLTTLSIPDTSSATDVSSYLMLRYASNCDSLTTLVLPKAGWFKTHDVDWGVEEGRLGYLRGVPTSRDDDSDWAALTASGKTLYLNYIRDADDVGIMKITGDSMSLSTSINTISLTSVTTLSVNTLSVATSNTSLQLLSNVTLSPNIIAIATAEDGVGITKIYNLSTNNINLSTLQTELSSLGVEYTVSPDVLNITTPIDSNVLSSIVSLPADSQQVSVTTEETKTMIGYAVPESSGDNIYIISAVQGETPYTNQYALAQLHTNNKIYEVIKTDGI